MVLLCHLMVELKTEHTAGFGCVADFFGFFYDFCNLLQKQTNENLTTNKNKKEKKKSSSQPSAWKSALTFSNLPFYGSGTR